MESLIVHYENQKDLDKIDIITVAKTNLKFAREMWINNVSMRNDKLKLLIFKRRNELDEILKDKDLK